VLCSENASRVRTHGVHVLDCKSLGSLVQVFSRLCLTKVRDTPVKRGHVVRSLVRAFACLR
jgi:hypothetical protein